MSKQFYVVVYDMPNDRRRTRLYNALQDFGTPVQYSVFECLLDAEEFARLKGRVAQIIKPNADHVRYYRLCAACQRTIETTGGPEKLEDDPVIIV